MQRISNTLTQIFPFRVFPTSNFKKTLGRWSNEQDNSKINTRIDWSNEDHCGACGDLLNIKKQNLHNTEKLQK